MEGTAFYFSIRYNRIEGCIQDVSGQGVHPGLPAGHPIIDKPERWQRSVLSRLLQAIQSLRPASPFAVQMLVATHSPLILASAEPLFEPDRDALWKLDLREGRVVMERDQWHRRGDVSDWLTSDVFDLGLARSREAERAIKAAMDLTCTADPDPQDILRITGDLSRVLSDTGRLREESPFVAAELERQGRLSLVAGSP